MKKRDENQRVSRLLWLKILLPVLGCLILMAAVWFCWHKITKVKVEHLHALVYSQIERVAELTVVKYNYGNVAVPKKSALNGGVKAYSIIKFQGVIRLGIRDLTEMEVNVSPDGKSVEVILPHAEVLENALISQEVFDEKRSIFVPISTQDIFDEIKNEMVRTEESALNEGILEEADERIVLLVRTLLIANGIHEPKINFKRKSVLPAEIVETLDELRKENTLEP